MASCRNRFSALADTESEDETTPDKGIPIDADQICSVGDPPSMDFFNGHRGKWADMTDEDEQPEDVPSVLFEDTDDEFYWPQDEQPEDVPSVLFEDTDDEFYWPQAAPTQPLTITPVAQQQQTSALASPPLWPPQVTQQSPQAVPLQVPQVPQTVPTQVLQQAPVAAPAQVSQEAPPVPSEQPPQQVLVNGLPPGTVPTMQLESNRVQKAALAAMTESPPKIGSMDVSSWKGPDSDISCYLLTLTKLTGTGSSVVSRRFDLSHPSFKASVSCMLEVSSLQSLRQNVRGGSSFRFTEGKCEISVKCDWPAQNGDTSVPLKFWLLASAGGGSNAFQRPRGPVEHDLSKRETSKVGLPQHQESWDFKTLLDKSPEPFIICLAVEPVSQ